MRYEAVIYDAGFGVFLVHPPMASVLLSASVERCFVSRMRDFFFLLYSFLFCFFFSFLVSVLFVRFCLCPSVSVIFYLFLFVSVRVCLSDDFFLFFFGPATAAPVAANPP